VQVDLNLLVALDALLEENSVQGAADRLHLSAPAMSRTLSRIRRATGDDILVRTGRTMTPTPRALALREETSVLVRRARQLLTPVQELDLATLKRVFVIRGHDALIGVLAADLARTASKAAPGVSFRFLAEATLETSDLQHGHVDLEIGATASAVPEISAAEIGVDRMVAVFRADHPLASRPLTARRFAAADHVNVSRRGRVRGPIDDVLLELGLDRRVLAAVPTSAAALEFVARSDAVTVVAERSCEPLRTRLGLAARVLPFELPPVPLILLWHRRHDSDLAHSWLRENVSAILRSALAK
jgi:DNA-binding transcriptional LysR family regulator